MTSRGSLSVVVAAGLIVVLSGCGTMSMDDPNSVDMGAAMGDSAAGKTFFDNNNCADCHASGGAGLKGVSSTTIFNKLSGATSHGGGTFNGVTQDDANDLAAYFATL